MRRFALKKVAARAAAGAGAVTLSVTGAFTTGPWAAAHAGVPSEAGVDITSPEDGRHADVAEELSVTGHATMPNDGPTETNVYFLVDTSLLNAIGDPCGSAGGGLACALEGVETMNGALGDAALDVSVIAFSGAAGGAPGAAAADASPAPGDQPFTTPDADADDDGVGDVDEVLEGTSVSGFEEFTAKSVGPSLFPDYDAALAELDRLIGLQPEGERNIAFLNAVGDLVIEETADASSEASSSPEMRAAASPQGRAQAVAAAVDGGLDDLVGRVTINTFAMPSDFAESVVGCEGSLGEIADATGGSCVEEPTEADYLSAIVDSQISVVEAFTVTVNGDEIDSELALDGAFSATVPADTLEEGENTIVATALVQIVDGSASAGLTAASASSGAGGGQVSAQAVDVMEASDTVTVIGTVAAPVPNDGGGGAPAPNNDGGGGGAPAPTDVGGAQVARSDSGPEL
nr:hypothetical protein [Actinomycetota bacterium]